MKRTFFLGTAFVALMVASGQATQQSDYQILPTPVQQHQPVVLAQATDSTYRVNELEQEVRRLTGKVEELGFQLLQMQEKIRKMQEDNELRFQELEEKRSDATDAAPKTDDSKVATIGENSLGKPEPSETIVPDVNSESRSTPTLAPNASGEPKLAPGPRALGTLTFDDKGNVVNSKGSEKGDGNKVAALPLPGVFSDGVDGGIEAAEFGPTPDAVFNVGLAALNSKRYKRAESAFRSYMKAWPNDPREGEARYYLAEALFRQKDYYNAANVYLDTHNAYPQAPTAADNLLGLGLALAGLNQREVACATYSEVLKQYPQAKPRLGARLDAEQFSAKCL